MTKFFILIGAVFVAIGVGMADKLQHSAQAGPQVAAPVAPAVAAAPPVTSRRDCMRQEIARRSPSQQEHDDLVREIANTPRFMLPQITEVLRASERSIRETAMAICGSGD